MNNIITKTNGRPATFGSVVDQLFQTNLDRFIDDRFWGLNGQQKHPQVPVNIRETDTAYELQLVAPGLKKEDFHLNYSDTTLTVSFVNHDEKTGESPAKWVRREYRALAFTRTFTLDDRVDADKATARYENGILELTLPKKEEAKPLPKAIAIQ